jgi:hypothetical protein
MALYPAPATVEARVQAHRMRMTRYHVYACRFCRESVKVTSTHYLPDTCAGCGASTWGEDGRCANWIHCDGMRRPGVRGRSHCHHCGTSVWTLVSTGTPARFG